MLFKNIYTVPNRNGSVPDKTHGLLLLNLIFIVTDVWEDESE